MPAFSAQPQCYVDIYPFEGGVYSLLGVGSALLGVEVSKSIAPGSVGQFSISLAPGGPGGPNASPSWTEVITPMSLVVIGKQRYVHKQIVMIGVVSNVTEPTEWAAGRPVRRAIQVQGADFAYLFTTYNFYLQTYLAGTAFGPLGSVGFLSMQGDGLLAGTPDAIGAAWFNTVMAGPNGVLSQTSFAYQGSRVKFTDMMSTEFDPYDANIDVPMADFYLSADGSWMDKFQSIFPYPFYECFVTTAPVGFYPKAKLANTFLTSMQGGFPSATPHLIARVNPLPWTPNKNGPTSMDFTRWDALPEFEPDNYGFINSSVFFSADDVRNFYLLNPTGITAQFGASNAQLAPWMFQFAGWVDPASIHRYGYRPQITEVRWLSDITGQSAQQNAANGQGLSDLETLVGNLSLRVTSFFEPTPLMARATVTMELRPDIMPGCKFLYPPHKDGRLWLFYIDGVSHTWQMGHSTTTLTLGRGLPQEVYSNSDLMLAIHTGNAMRIEGSYEKGLPSGVGTGLEVLNQASMLNGVMGDIAQIFGSPQGKTS